MTSQNDMKPILCAKILIAVFGLILASSPRLFAEDIPGQVRWNLKDLYATDQDWNSKRIKVTEQIETIARLKGSLGESAESLFEALDKISTINKEAARVFIYASLKADEDSRDSAAQEKLNQALAMFAELEQATLFIAPEVKTLGKDRIDTLISQNPALSRHALRLYDVFTGPESSLDEKTQKKLARTAEELRDAQLAYRRTVAKSILWPWVTLDSGQGLTVNPATYVQYRAVNSRNDRKRIFDAYWKAWKLSERSIGQSLNSTISSHVTTAKLNGFNSALDQAMAQNDLSADIYHSLIDAATKSLPSLHRYLKLKQRIMGLENSQYYDLHRPATYLEQRFTLAEAKELTSQALTPYGGQYIAHLKNGFSGEWMHVYPQPGKQSGAYTQNAGYDVHPYLLLNFNRQYGGVATFAHEWGHAIHSMLSREVNPIETYSYNTFVGELASSTNEVLLHEHMLSQDLSDPEYLYYINQSLESISASFFRQTMFAEFELNIHTLSESGEALTGERLSEIYLTLLRKYYGHDKKIMTIDPNYAIEWAYISHFFNGFTVYQNAASIAGGSLFASRILAGNTNTRNLYIKMLQAGGSMPPQKLLLAAGIDLASDEPYTALTLRMERLMDAADIILSRMGR